MMRQSHPSQVNPAATAPTLPPGEASSFNPTEYGLSSGSPSHQAAAEQGYAPVADPQKKERPAKIPDGPEASNRVPTETEVQRAIDNQVNLLNSSNSPANREAARRIESAMAAQKGSTTG